MGGQADIDRETDTKKGQALARQRGENKFDSAFSTLFLLWKEERGVLDEWFGFVLHFNFVLRLEFLVAERGWRTPYFLDLFSGPFLFFLLVFLVFFGLLFLYISWVFFLSLHP